MHFVNYHSNSLILGKALLSIQYRLDAISAAGTPIDLQSRSPSSSISEQHLVPLPGSSHPDSNPIQPLRLPNSLIPQRHQPRIPRNHILHNLPNIPHQIHNVLRLPRPDRNPFNKIRLSRNDVGPLIAQGDGNVLTTVGVSSVLAGQQLDPAVASALRAVEPAHEV